MPEYKFTPQKGKIKTIRDARIRGGEPKSSSALVRTASKGEELSYLGWVNDGEKVDGNSKWFLDTSGNWFWSGNVIDGSIYTPVTATQLYAIVPTLSLSKANDYINSLNATMQEFSIITPLRQAAFIAQTAHESAGYSAFAENLNYSSTALLSTWPTRFTNTTAQIYARKPEQIANHVYANRGGNGDEASGDGWRYRGRGVIQITFKDNYSACGIGLGLNLISSPEILEQPLYAFRSAGWYWKSRNLNNLADTGDFIGITRMINGGLNGLDDRTTYHARAKTVLGII